MEMCANYSRCLGIDPPFRGVYRKPFCYKRSLHVAHTRLGESMVDQNVGGLTFSKGQRVFLDLAHASVDVSHTDFFRTPLHTYARF